MTRFTIIDRNDQRHEMEGTEADSVMQVAVRAGIEGIVAECNGSLSCATCHVYVDAKFLARLPEPSPDEADMLDFTAAERRPGSRLSCQIRLGPELDGLIVTLPDTQV